MPDSPIVRERPRRQTRSETTRRALLDAALYEFAAHGYEAASTRSIAARAGTQQPQINYHFDSKLALWQAAVDHLFVRLDDAMAPGTLSAADDIAPSRAQLAELVRSLVRAVARLPELNRIMVHEATTDSDRLAWIVERHVRPRFEGFTSAWRRLRAAGEVPDVDEVIVYYTLLGGASLLYVNAPEARRLLGRDPVDATVVAAHAEALASMVLGPDPRSDTRPERSP